MLSVDGHGHTRTHRHRSFSMLRASSTGFTQSHGHCAHVQSLEEETKRGVDERDTGFAPCALHACCAQKHACKTQDAPDLRVRDTTVEPRLRVRLVLAVAVASGGTATHGANRLGRPNQTDETMVA